MSVTKYLAEKSVTIYQTSPNSNFNGVQYTTVGYSVGIIRSLTGFNFDANILSGTAIPSGAVINSVQFVQKIYSGGADPDNYDEGQVYGLYDSLDNTWTQTGVTYNNQPANHNLIKDINFSDIGDTPDELVISNAALAAAVQSALASRKITLKSTPENTNKIYKNFEDHRYSSSIHYPYLLVDYSVPITGTTTFSPSKSVQIQESFPNTNFDSLKYRRVGFDGSGHFDSLVEFDLENNILSGIAIPAGATIISAFFTDESYFLNGADFYSGQGYELLDVLNTDEWTQTGVTWNNQPELVDPVGSGMEFFNTGGTQDFTFDVTTEVNALFDAIPGSKRFSLLSRAINNFNAYADIKDHRYDSSIHFPILVVNYNAPSAGVHNLLLLDVG